MPLNRDTPEQSVTRHEISTDNMAASCLSFNFAAFSGNYLLNILDIPAPMAASQMVQICMQEISLGLVKGLVKGLDCALAEAKPGSLS